jgi:hypothetical protein
MLETISIGGVEIMVHALLTMILACLILIFIMLPCGAEINNECWCISVTTVCLNGITYWYSEPHNVTLKTLIDSSHAGNQTLGPYLKGR